MSEYCVSLIGMPGSGKTTIGKKLAELLTFAFLDTDLLIESIYGRRLQDITEIMAVEQFRDVECNTIKNIAANYCVIATGGSAIYRRQAIDHLKSLGPLIYLSVPLEIIMERIMLNPERGISFQPGQTLPDLYRERSSLYDARADIKCDTSLGTPEDCALWIKQQLKTRPGKIEI